MMHQPMLEYMRLGWLCSRWKWMGFSYFSETPIFDDGCGKPLRQTILTRGCHPVEIDAGHWERYQDLSTRGQMITPGANLYWNAEKSGLIQPFLSRKTLIFVVFELIRDHTHITFALRGEGVQISEQGGGGSGATVNVRFLFFCRFIFPQNRRHLYQSKMDMWRDHLPRLSSKLIVWNLKNLFLENDVRKRKPLSAIVISV